MPHIHTEPGQHDHTVSAIIIRLDTPKPSATLHLHKLAHKWMQFGGHVELHENPWAAISHEIVEESGYHMDQLRILQPKSRATPTADAIFHPQPVAIQTHRFSNLNHFHTDTSYAFVTHGPPAHAIGEGESKEVALFTLQQVAAIPPEQIPPNVRTVIMHALSDCLHDWEAIDTAYFNQSLL